MDKRSPPTAPAPWGENTEGAAVFVMFAYLFVHILAMIAAGAGVFAVMVYDNTFQIGMDKAAGVFGQAWWFFFCCAYSIHTVLFGFASIAMLDETRPAPTAPKVQPPPSIPAKTFPFSKVFIVYTLYAVLAIAMHYSMYLVKFGEGNLGAPRALALVLSACGAALMAPIFAVAYRP